MLWIKALHIVFVVSWFAGLFYLPRIFVNLAMVAPGSIAERARLVLWLGYGIGRGPGNGWLHAKLAVVLALLAYHAACGRMLARFERGEPARGHVWFRWFNELPVLGLLAAVILVTVKPF